MPLWVRFALFFLTVFGVVGGLSYYVGTRISHAFELSPRARRRLRLGLMLTPMLPLSGRLLERALGSVAGSLSATGFVLVVATLIAAALVAPLHLVEALTGRFRKPRAAASRAPSATPPEPTAAPEEPSRRTFLQAAIGGAVVTSVGSAVYGSVFGRHEYVIEEVPVKIDGLSPKLSGYRIAQLSDIHFGQFVGEAERRSAFEFVRRTHPDLIVLTGDLVDSHVNYVPELGRLTRQLAELGARDGVVVVPGNHDYYTGIGAVLGGVRAAGARVLVNQGICLGQPGAQFALLGVDDIWARRERVGAGPDLVRASARVGADLPRILLCHNPEFFREARGKVALQLSGHTHGGQVNPLMLHPANLFLPYVRGLYREEGSLLYVNRGFGTAGPPMRLAAPPEISLVVLTA